MRFEQEMKKFNSFNNKQKRQKILNLLKELKDKNEKINNIYVFIEKSENIGESTLNKIYKILLEAMIYIQGINQEKLNNKINKINNVLKDYLEEEKKEKEIEESELDKLLEF